MEIDFNDTAFNAHKKVCAFSPKPGAYTYFKNKRVQLFNSENKMNNSIDDFINGVVTAWKTKECIGEIINLGHNQPRQIREVIDILAERLGQPARLEYRPPHPGDLPLTCADLNKAQSLFDYRPKVSLEEGLEHFARWFCDQPSTDNSNIESP